VGNSRRLLILLEFKSDGVPVEPCDRPRSAMAKDSLALIAQRMPSPLSYPTGHACTRSTCAGFNAGGVSRLHYGFGVPFSSLGLSRGARRQ
jgi:hypothetical protein